MTQISSLAGKGDGLGRMPGPVIAAGIVCHSFSKWQSSAPFCWSVCHSKSLIRRRCRRTTDQKVGSSSLSGRASKINH